MNIGDMILLFRHEDQGANSFSIAQEAITKLIGTRTTIFGDTLIPLVSSSKNLRSPALEAGSGLLLFLSANETTEEIYHKNFLTRFSSF